MSLLFAIDHADALSLTSIDISVSVARVPVVAAVPTAVDFLSASGVSIIFGVPAIPGVCCCLPEVVGVSAVAGAIVAANFPAVANVPATVGDTAVVVVPALVQY